MHWMRKPRLNSAVATVAVETDLSLLRVASVSLVIVSFSPLRHSGMRLLAQARNDESINRRLADRGAESGFEKIEVAAFVGLFDVFRKHPAIAALETALRLFPFAAAPCQ